MHFDRLDEAGVMVTSNLLFDEVYFCTFFKGSSLSTLFSQFPTKKVKYNISPDFVRVSCQMA